MRLQSNDTFDCWVSGKLYITCKNHMTIDVKEPTSRWLMSMQWWHVLWMVR